MTSSNNKTALITGATSGIGYELARLLAADGYDMVIVARTAEDLSETSSKLSQEFGIRVYPIACDLFEPDAAFELYEEVTNLGLTVDVLVNDAGQGQFGLFVEQDIDRLLDIIQLNVSSVTVLTHLFLKV